MMGIWLLLAGIPVSAQILTSSPYSRYGIGEINTQSFSAINAMGGSVAAFQPDTAAPFFINIANPASLSGLRLSVFELGGQAQFSRISSASASANKRNINFSYGSLGFPLRRFGGAAFGIMPYSTVGYKITSYTQDINVGQLKYVYNGDGGFNKAFLASGVIPFRKQLPDFFNSLLYDSLVRHHQYAKLARKKVWKQLISELAIGASANYIFGTTNQTTDVILPGSTTYYNTRRRRTAHISDVSFNTGIQTSFTIDHAKQRVTTVYKDSLTGVTTSKDTIVRRTLKQRVRIAFGAYANLPRILSATQSTLIYNYSLDGFGNEQPTDTSLNSINTGGSIRVPLEVGAGFSVKKGERFTFLADAAITKWSDFRYFNSDYAFQNSHRVSVGINYVPNKLAYGTANYIKRAQYRMGFTYSDGFLDLKNSRINNYAITAGLGLPVGIGRFDDIAVVNISAQFGTMGTTTNSLLKENYIRMIIGFTFNKRWFIKYKYD